jgi:hypothetical protein
MLSEPIIQHPSRKLYALLGELLQKKEPETYAKLIQLIPTQPKTEITEVVISEKFASFCMVQNIAPAICRDSLYDRSIVDQKRLFVGIIIKLYGVGQRRLGKHLSSALGQQKQITSKMIAEAEVRYRVGGDFRDLVDITIEKMKEAGYGTD